MLNSIRDFLKLESAGGILLVIAAAIAMAVANSPLAGYYVQLLNMPIAIHIGSLSLAKPLLLWINDGLMVVFFFLVGLELKREVVEGELSDLRKITLPVVGAIGGMVFPAFIYTWFNLNDAVAIKGWAIPSPTDIAFALGVLALLGSRVPSSLKIFLVSLAIFDDLGAIIIIAVFYSHGQSTTALLVVLVCILVLFLLNRRNVSEIIPYGMVGVVMWCALLKSGVHATLAGVILAFFIPRRNKREPERSPLRELEHDLHEGVAFGILPLFAFVNSGIMFSRDSLEHMLHPVPLGIALGLFIGKQTGVFTFCWLSVKLGIAKLPGNMNWRSLYGVALLCGVGFTMSLFIGSLAFENTGVNLMFDERLGIIAGSLFSGTVGYFFLRNTLAVSEKDLLYTDVAADNAYTFHPNGRVGILPSTEPKEVLETVGSYGKDDVCPDVT